MWYVQLELTLKSTMGYGSKTVKCSTSSGLQTVVTLFDSGANFELTTIVYSLTLVVCEWVGCGWGVRGGESRGGGGRLLGGCSKSSTY